MRVSVDFSLSFTIHGAYIYIFIFELKLVRMRMVVVQ